MRLIDADVLNSRMYHEAFEKDTGMQRWDSGLWIRYKIFEQVLQDMPTVDVRPNVKGKWLSTYTAWIYCSECGSEPPNESNYRSKYCPWCGARMDGDTE